MGCLKSLQNILKQIDLFSTTELIRFKGDSRFSSTTGGLVTIFILIGFAAAFISNSVAVWRKQTIISKDTIQYQGQPSLYNLNVSKGDLMFAIGIQDFNLSLPNKRFFDIIVESKTKNYGYRRDNQTVKLQTEPCQYQKWAKLSDFAAKTYKEQQYNRYLCLKNTSYLKLAGKYSSEWFNYIKISVRKCNPDLDKQRPCDEIMTKMSSNQSFSFQIHFINAFVNSGQSKLVKYYLEERNYQPFRTSSTSLSNIFVTEQVVSIDNSIMPWQNLQNISIPAIRQPGFTRSNGFKNDSYVVIYLRKSPYVVYSTRRYDKIATYLSFLGGLFSFLLFGFFIIKYFNTALYELHLADKLFYFSPQNPLKSSKYGFFTHLKQCIYRIAQKLGWNNLQWQHMQMYSKCRDEVNEQLDISLLLNKINFFQTCMTILFQQHQYRSIFLQQKPTVKQAETVRVNHGLNKLIHQNFVKKIKSTNKQIKKQEAQQKKLQFIKQIQHINNNEPNQQNNIQNQNQKIKIDLLKIITGFSLEQISPKYEKNQQQKSLTESKKKKQLNKMEKQIEQIGGNHEDRVKFLNLAIQDIKKIQYEAENGNQISKRIYNRLNTDTTKQKFKFISHLQKLMKKIDTVKLQKQKKQKQSFNPANLIGNIFNIKNNSSKEPQGPQSAKRIRQQIKL